MGGQQHEAEIKKDAAEAENKAAETTETVATEETTENKVEEEVKSETENVSEEAKAETTEETTQG